MQEIAVFYGWVYVVVVAYGLPGSCWYNVGHKNLSNYEEANYSTVPDGANFFLVCFRGNQEFFLYKHKLQKWFFPVFKILKK